MLNRRYLRIKTLQALYAYFQSAGDVVKSENIMVKDLYKVYNLYLYMILLLIDIVEVARRNIELAKEKRLPSEQDLNPNTRFIDNPVFKLIENNKSFKRLIENKKINWQTEDELVRKLYRDIKDSADYENYMNRPICNFQDHKDFAVKIYKRFIAGSELVHQLMEERDINWYDDIVLVNISVIKTISTIKELGDDETEILLPLFKDEKDDLEFVRDLFKKTISGEDTFEKMISSKTKNWEMERLAMMDVLLMKMALCELINFKSIPVKVTLNEYIEISKNYSTPKSKTFINGILDKVVLDLKGKGELIKSGRGLVE